MTILVAIPFDDIRDRLEFFCSVPVDTAFLAYEPNSGGIMWLTARTTENLHVALLMRPNSFAVHVVRAVPITLLSFNASVFGQMIPLVPNDRILLCTIDPLQPKFEFSLLNLDDGTQTYKIPCQAIAAADDYVLSMLSFIIRLHRPGNYPIKVSRNVMRDFVLHSLTIREPIAVISWGHLVMICCEANRLIYLAKNDAAASRLNGTYRCFRLSLHNPHVVNYPFENADWFFSCDYHRPVRAFQQDDNFLVYLTVRPNSYAEPEVLPPLR